MVSEETCAASAGAAAIAVIAGAIAGAAAGAPAVTATDAATAGDAAAAAGRGSMRPVEMGASNLMPSISDGIRVVILFQFFSENLSNGGGNQRQ